jgi:arginase
LLLCLNSEWQGCENRQLERGARDLARELFGVAPYLDLGPSDCDSLDTRDGVFALDCVVARFRRTLLELERAAPERVFTVGGTCGSEAAPVAYLARRHASLGVVWFDAHGDLNTPATSPSGHFHGMVLRALLGDGPSGLTDHIARPLDPACVVVAGVRDLDAAEREYASCAGLALIEGWPEDTAERIRDALRSAGVTQLYIHVDVDVFDPAAYGDALFSVPGGPSLDSVASVARTLVDAFDVVGVGLVESCGRIHAAPQAIAGFLAASGLRLAD